MNLIQLKKNILARYSESGIHMNEAAVEVDILSQHYLGVTKTDLLLSKDIEINPKKLVALFDILDKRLKKRIPLQYLLGFTYFYGLKFLVDPSVLIPRSDTELLVDLSLDVINKYKCKNVADIGTGSGCIAVSVLKNCPDINFVCTDISEKSLNTAINNAEIHKVKSRAKFVCTSILEKIEESFDLIISNPPYILESEKETLEPEVYKHEPYQALFIDDSDPVSIYRAISKQGYSKLRSAGRIILEISYNRADLVKDLLMNDGWLNIKVHKDLGQNNRAIIAEKP